ncbi:cytochrome B562 [Devosia epidermidihirudinis]|uniref:Cytochrome c oxidase subunit 3 n=1 Tax=Devosia epidermidihirudinis TaxID=1293439 RepID=A0A0F5QKL8_9HYPH|nr:cytochrome c oxidase subunit 3 [Devosia epidermidihirudinis]KKC41253.1 cytochrome B562 [Devosia epidermidihirudinis]KKC41271.1 cytochrome B562 [Devosia epidermidihirudinis]
MSAITKNHDYHMVEPSPWPFVMSAAVFVFALGIIFWMHQWTPFVFFIGLVGVLYTMYAWWSDVIKEANNGVDHTPVVQMHHRYGMMLFIASEVMVFFGFFWAYFDGFFRFDDIEQYARVAATGGHWPPTGIELFDPFHLPLFNTLLLLTSGTTVTWAHHALLENDREGLKWGLILTVALGAVFTVVQGIEYSEAGFSFAGDMYGATFFMATGLHGLHVLIGTIFLAVCLLRAYRGDFTPERHLGFEFAAWYWHFVDVVWLFLFASIYVWGSWGVALSH